MGAHTRLAAGVVAVALVVAACGGSSPDEAREKSPAVAFEHPAAPAAPDGPLDEAVAGATGALVQGAIDGDVDLDALAIVAASGDARLAWVLQDLLRFIQSGADQEALVAGFVTLTGVDPANDPQFDQSPWRSVANHLIAWDLPAPPDYRETKATLFVEIEPGWAPFFDDDGSSIDWRLMSWGGVLIDDRPLGDDGPCIDGCIPALDDPALTNAADGDWYPDEAVVFGITEGDQSVALPKNIMEVHEMVNLTLDGRRLGIPYCTLCGAAQAYDTGGAPGEEDLVLRTSGLLSRSNKVMYDLTSQSVLDTFTGEALSGPLHDEDMTLEQTTVVVTSWGEWRSEHPDTRIIAEDGGIGRTYPEDPLRGRDDDGPIFPIGEPDPRLPIQAQVLGVIAPDGTPVAFDADRARAALSAGDAVEAAGVEVVSEGGGLRAQSSDGDEVQSNQAFWFAWSQFHPDTVVWTPLGG